MLTGHLWTIAPRVRHSLATRTLAPVGFEEDPNWSTRVFDDRWGSVRITGTLRSLESADSIVVIVPGLGGNRESHYLPEATRAAATAGFSSLVLELRGSDLEGEDLYHAGLTADVGAALASVELERYQRVFLVGYSLGGHLALKYATEEPDPRLVSVAAVCAPLDLRAAQEEFDRPGRWLYRQYILGRLRKIYRPVDKRRELPTPLEEVLGARTLREWDRLTVAPRFGFSGPEEYYSKMSVASRLDSLQVPALLIASEGDPMVPPEALHEALFEVPDRLQVCWVPGGGHVSFPTNLDLGFGGELGLGNQVMGWSRKILHG